MSNSIPDPGLTVRLRRSHVEQVILPQLGRLPDQMPLLSKPQRGALRDLLDQLRAALSAPQEEGEGLEAGADAFLHADIKWGTYSDRTAIVLGLRAAAPVLQAAERRRLEGLLQPEIDRLREIQKDCAEVAADAFEKEEGERPLRAELARIQADEAESAAERLEAILAQLRIVPAPTQSAPEHSGVEKAVEEALAKVLAERYAAPNETEKDWEPDAREVLAAVEQVRRVCIGGELKLTEDWKPEHLLTPPSSDQSKEEGGRQ